ncbi:hypothetical protein ONS95_003430 [Cadophora gregata]|uniref:uncharacterized protein n=1 Tax=Cadophora gregata TaxID=51156 RepID=UPI0026DAFADE|nr:uncharacterized protein ONS95_003430 [Cadophora gregata]KAK0108637.1 hypothetical protein ONS95_003430 [Cadophora gregata]KAK0108772.1 hypothetical protein ONS96_002617 [Cadophora gregata f. sp. sojae]
MLSVDSAPSGSALVCTTTDAPTPKVIPDGPDAVPSPQPAPQNGVSSADSNDISNTTSAPISTAVTSTSGTLNANVSAPTRVSSAPTALTPATTPATGVPSSTTQSVSAPSPISRQPAVRAGKFRHYPVQGPSHSARPLPPITWGPGLTSGEYGRGSQPPAYSSSMSSTSEAGNGSIQDNSLPSKSSINNTTDGQDFADFSVKPPTPAGPSAHFDKSPKIQSHSIKNPVSQQCGFGGVAFSVVDGRPRLEPVKSKDKTGKTQPASDPAVSRNTSGQPSHDGIPKVQTLSGSQRPVTESSFDPFHGPAPGERLPFWFLVPSATPSSGSPYGPHTSSLLTTPSKTTSIQNGTRIGRDAILLRSGRLGNPVATSPNGVTGQDSVPRNSSINNTSGTLNGGTTRTPLPSTPVKTASANAIGDTLLPARSSSEPTSCGTRKQSEVYQRMERRLIDIESGTSAVTVDDLIRLEHLERALLSDFYILHGVFLQHPHYPGQPNEAAFIAGGFRNPKKFYAYEDRVKDLKSKVQKREEKQAAEEPDREKDWSKQVKEEHSTLNILYSEVLNCKKFLTELRKYLERENKVIPKGYRKSGAAIQKKGIQSADPKTANGKKRRTVITIDSDDNSSEQGSTPSATQPPRKKAKMQPAQGAKMTSAMQFKPIGKVVNDSALHQQQQQRGQHQFQVRNGSTMHQQPRGTVQAMNGSSGYQQPNGTPRPHGQGMDRSGYGMQRHPRNGQPSPHLAQPRTPAYVDREIALRMAMIERLNEEVLELRWEKKVLENNGQPGGA